MAENENMKTEMEIAAIATHEMFINFIRAGFNEDQALALVIASIGGLAR